MVQEVPSNPTAAPVVQEVPSNRTAAPLSVVVVVVVVLPLRAMEPHPAAALPLRATEPHPAAALPLRAMEPHPSVNPPVDLEGLPVHSADLHLDPTTEVLLDLSANHLLLPKTMALLHNPTVLHLVADRNLKATTCPLPLATEPL
mgnify:CR=1 FL=1